MSVEPTRILFVNRRFEYGGAERQLLEFLKGVDKSRFRIGVATLYGGGPLWDEVGRIPGVELVSLGKRGRWDIGVVWKFVKMMRRFRPHIVHGHMTVANLLSLAGKLVNAKIVWGVRSAGMDLSRYDHLSRLVFRAECRLSRLADLVICNSEAGRAFVVAHGFPASRAIVVPNGIDTTGFRADPAARMRLRAEWDIADGERVVGLVARIDPMKGHSVFLAAAAQVIRRYPDVRFMCVGDGPGPLRKNLMRAAAAHGLGDRLVWYGPCADVPGVLSALDVAVSASIFGEGFSNALGEAMACGVPCVATDVGDSAKILGDAGWLVRPGDADDLARGMMEALQALDEGRVDEDRLRALIETRFGLSRLVENTAAALEQIAAR